MKLRKEILKYLLYYTLGVTILNLGYGYFISPKNNFLVGDDIRSSIFIGLFTGIAVYFNHFTLKGEKRYSKKKQAEANRN